MSDKNRNLIVRIVSAGIALPIILWVIALGGWYFAALITVAGAITVSEYYGITLGRLSPPALFGCLAMGLLPLWVEYVAGLTRNDPARHIPTEVSHSFLGFVLLLLLVFFVGWLFELFTGAIKEGPTKVAHVVTGFVYVGLGLGALTALRVLLPNGVMWIIAALVITWANDTLAYFAGRLFGKHKLAPTVSPNKTWEGFFGGMVGSIGGLFIMRLVYPQFAVVDCIVLGLLGGCFGPVGDLCESMLKRAYGVKDSGKALPGHGGFLDRIDALLFNAPIALAYASFAALVRAAS